MFAIHSVFAPGKQKQQLNVMLLLNHKLLNKGFSYYHHAIYAVTTAPIQVNVIVSASHQCQHPYLEQICVCP